MCHMQKKPPESVGGYGFFPHFIFRLSWCVSVAVSCLFSISNCIYSLTHNWIETRPHHTSLLLMPLTHLEAEDVSQQPESHMQNGVGRSGEGETQLVKKREKMERKTGWDGKGRKEGKAASGSGWYILRLIRFSPNPFLHSYIPVKKRSHLGRGCWNIQTLFNVEI